MLSTYLELSRIPDAPCTGFGVANWSWSLFGKTSDVIFDPAFFRWAKAVDRAIGLFAEHELEGKPINSGELRELSECILAKIPPTARLPNVTARGFAWARHRASWQVLEEWKREPDAGVGPLTRLLQAWEVARDTQHVRHTFRAFRAGEYPALGFVSPAEASSMVREHPDRIIHLGVETGRRRLTRTASGLPPTA
jgi:hypothetical protein